MTFAMKKVIICALAALCLAFSASAQPRTIGLRAGGDLEASFQYGFKNNNFLEIGLGCICYKQFAATVGYQIILAKDCFKLKGMNVYAGPVLAFGAYKHDDGQYQYGMAFGGDAGIEYNFAKIPLVLSLDWRPTCDMCNSGANWASVALGIRYRF